MLASQHENTSLCIQEQFKIVSVEGQKTVS